MALINGWLDWAERVPNVVKTPEGNFKVNGATNPVIGAVLHSAEGYESYLRNYQSDPAYASRRASWHLSVLFNGHVMQHFPIFAQCWHGGSSWPNNHFLSIEHEGWSVRNDPMTDAQVVSSARILRECLGDRGIALVRQQTLWEHNECTRWGSLPTACPSGRIRWNDVIAAATYQPPTVRRRDMAIIIGPNNAHYLVAGSITAWIPPEHYNSIYNMVYGTQPATFTQAALDWLHGQEVNGQSQGARFIRVY